MQLQWYYRFPFGRVITIMSSLIFYKNYSPLHEIVAFVIQIFQASLQSAELLRFQKLILNFFMEHSINLFCGKFRISYENLSFKEI